MKQGPVSNGLSVIKLDDYIKSFEAAEFTYDKYYLDQFMLEYHVFDIFDNFMNDYFFEDKQRNLKILELDEIEKMDYAYNPKALSNLIYKTPDLWQLILKVNGFIHPGEMSLDKDILVPTADALSDFLNRMDKVKETIGGNLIDLKDVKY